MIHSRDNRFAYKVFAHTFVLHFNTLSVYCCVRLMFTQLAHFTTLAKINTRDWIFLKENFNVLARICFFKRRFKILEHCSKH